MFVSDNETRKKMKTKENVDFVMTTLNDTEAVIRWCSVEKVFLKISQNSQENTCTRVSSRLRSTTLLKKETLAQVFSCKFCEISKNTFFTKHLRWLLFMIQ